jgi:AcrR family transcriptional regulator
MDTERQAPRRRGRPPASQTEDVGREALIDSARKIFATEDPAKINRRIFAERAGVDPSLVRYYFGNMKRLMAEVLADNHRQARAQMFGIREDHEPDDRLLYRVERTFRMFRDQPNHHRMVRTVLYEGADSKDLQDWHALLRDSVSDLNDILEAGASRGKMRPGVDAAALHLLIVAACEFWTTNEPVIAVVFYPRTVGEELDRYFINFLEATIAASLRP